MTSLIGRDKIVDSLFFLFLGMIGGFIGSGIMSCGIQKMVTESIYIKHVIFFVLIYFAIGFVDSTTNSPMSIFLSALLVYFIFMLLMKSQKEFVLISVVLLGLLYIMRKLRDSYDEENDSSTIEAINNLSNALTFGMFAVLLLGFGIYFRRQYMEHRDNFQLQSFFFGTNKCSSLNK